MSSERKCGELDLEEYATRLPLCGTGYNNEYACLQRAL
jgi:hypothetical protein